MKIARRPMRAMQECQECGGKRFEVQAAHTVCVECGAPLGGGAPDNWSAGAEHTERMNLAQDKERTARRGGAFGVEGGIEGPIRSRNARATAGPKKRKPNPTKRPKTGTLDRTDEVNTGRQSRKRALKATPKKGAKTRRTGEVGKATRPTNDSRGQSGLAKARRPSAKRTARSRRGDLRDQPGGRGTTRPTGADRNEGLGGSPTEVGGDEMQASTPHRASRGRTLL